MVKEKKLNSRSFLSKYFDFDNILLVLLGFSLIGYYLKLLPESWAFYTLAPLSFAGAIPVVWSAILAIKNKHITVDLLASIALVFSLLSKEWVSAIFINLMLTSARIFLTYTEARARKNIESLLKLKPVKTKVKTKNGIVEVFAEQIKVGDIVVIDLGERIPVDGIVVGGGASLDQSSLTGESLPVTKAVGDEVFSSTLVVAGNLLVETKKVGSETTLEKIIELVEKSQANKASISTLADKFATVYISVVLVGSIVLYLFLRDPSLVLSVLLVVCADDIAVAVPMAFLMAIGYGARRGVIIKGANYLEAISHAKVLIVDKTGTLTVGQMQVEKIVSFDGEPENVSLSLAGSLAVVSDHPVAKAIVRFISKKGIKINPADDFKEIQGKGSIAEEKGVEILFGKPSFLVESGVSIIGANLEKISELETGGFNVTVLAINKKLSLAFVLADALKPQIKETIEKLKKDGLTNVVMLTGDNEKIAERVSEQTGIVNFHANLLPADKIKYLKKYLNKNYKVIMVGDGINDAAALSLSDIGIAMGGIGYDVAIESADIVLMKDDFKKIHEVIKLSRYVQKVVIQNFWIWGIVNAVGLVLVFTKILHPTSAAAFNFITDFLPLLNSSRIFGLYLKGK